MKLSSLVPALIVVANVLCAGDARGQVSGGVEIRDGQGRALVRNSFRVPVDVEIALWESAESGGRVRLVQKAEGGLWPTEFRLDAGEMQTVRVLMGPDAYPRGTRLRLETRFIPVPDRVVATATKTGGSSPGRTEARLTIVTRILSKVWIR